MSHSATIAFIGAGNMSQAIIAGLIRGHYPADQIIATRTNSEALAQLAAQYAIHTTTDNHAAMQQADVIVLAVKPQMMAQMLAEVTEKGIDLSNKLVISVAAGLSCQRLTQLLGQPCALVRAMPNTPCLVGLGMTGLFAESLTEQQRSLVETIFNGTGKWLWLAQEQQIDHVIAAAGSAPAYLFLFLEAMQQKAMTLGFDEATARLLINQTALGAAQMVASQPDSLAELRAKVTSKGGTTHAAICHFEQLQLREIVADAMQAAIDRAQQLAQTL